ncbi:MAG TPA: phosphoribosyl-ATP diphosphatase [Egibacteraceae bacterium]|nr:phosphoribosyl-ATP diphosphatase [Egibacteraceae bacterium]
MEILSQLEAVLRDRLRQPPPGSYSATLLADPERVARKIMEESFELCLELGRRGADGAATDRRRVAEEAADVLFHVLAGVVGAGVGLDDVLRELEARRH